LIDVPTKIKEVVAATHLPMIDGAFGQSGVDAAFRIMEVATALYRHVELERVRGSVVIFEVLVGRGETPVPKPSEPLADFASIANSSIADIILEVHPDARTYRLAVLPKPPEELAKNAVVYLWRPGQEEFLAGSQRKPVMRLDTVAASQFAVPTFSTLREALQSYARENVRESTCVIFREAWFEEKRIFFRAGPESTMRTSLIQFLCNRIGSDHDVWPEQKVNVDHPVDIRVQPRLSNTRLMLIEIKWLGWSAAEDGHITARHAHPRAQEGADQLAQYLDEQLQSAPSRVIQGYYVIIDGRRDHLKEGATTISFADGMHFESRELDFQPEHDKVRTDFDPPYRMFAKPKCTPDGAK
jgi:hypothetical protein